jgi:DNA-binding transcriptional ArsR family regulator
MKHGRTIRPMRASADARVRLLAELADETRFAVLERLEQGPASASELAQRLGVSPTQLANHLRRLREAGLVRVAHYGRLAIYELAEPGLREIFSMLNGLRRGPPRPGRAVPLAATCYDHLAGQLGVALMDHLLGAEALLPRAGEGELVLGPSAISTFGALGVVIPTTTPRRMLAYSCMDSIAARPHLGGQLGAELASSLRDQGWFVPTEQARRLELTRKGRSALRSHGIAFEEAEKETL